MADPVLRMEGISKSFAGVRALAAVDLSLTAGRVHAVVGENGAGKSTLIKIMTGAYHRDAGTIRLSGEPVDFRTPQDAQERGVVAVYQEVNLLSFRTVAENIMLGREPRRRFGFLDWPRLNAAAREVLARLGLEIEPTAPLGTRRTAQQQMVASARG
ncbi:MAG TPA: ATP-binding cassette domain-containing protein, partial [Kofleriaceae bacterium]|nr:ATP-binding cassette domain-containing protein [Kofleriaceae bacterium]